MQKLRKCICIIVVLIISLVGVVLVPKMSYAKDYFDGKYSGSIKNTNMKFYVAKSAINASWRPVSVFTKAFNWNGIDSKVKISSIAAYPAPESSYKSYFGITGGKIGTTLGATYYYNKSGAKRTTPYEKTYSISQRVGHTVTHEVGHALFLAHPVTHEPAVMTSGLPNKKIDRRTNITITTLDKKNLRSKW